MIISGCNCLMFINYNPPPLHRLNPAIKRESCRLGESYRPSMIRRRHLEKVSESAAVMTGRGED